MTVFFRELYQRQDDHYVDEGTSMINDYKEKNQEAS